MLFVTHLIFMHVWLSNEYMHLILEFWRDISLQGQMGGKNFIKDNFWGKEKVSRSACFSMTKNPLTRMIHNKPGTGVSSVKKARGHRQQVFRCARISRDICCSNNLFRLFESKKVLEKSKPSEWELLRSKSPQQTVGKCLYFECSPISPQPTLKITLKDWWSPWLPWWQWWQCHLPWDNCNLQV